MKIVPSLSWVVATLLLFGLIGCGGSPTFEVGSCARMDHDDTFTPTSCDRTTANYTVLARVPFGARDRRCEDVAAVSRSFYAVSTQETICLGKKGADPARSLNLVQAGDCTTATVAIEFERTDCSAADAVLRVLARTDDPSVPRNACKDVAGTMESYTWSLTTSGDAKLGLDRKIVLCLGPKDVGPSMMVDVATAGDCLTNAQLDTGRDVHRIDCGAPTAAHRVLSRIDNPSGAHEAACAGVEGTISTLQGTHGTPNGYVLCLGTI